MTRAPRSDGGSRHPVRPPVPGPLHRRRGKPLHRRRGPSRGLAYQLLAAAAVCIVAATAGAAVTLAVGRIGGADVELHQVRQAVGAGPSAGTDAARRTVDGEVLDLLVAHYYRPLDPAALRGTRLDLLPSVLGDRYTHYLKPDAVAAVALSDSGRFTGIGVLLAAGPAGATTAPQVTDVVAGSPAALAGIGPGDRVLDVDGSDVSAAPLADVLAALRGRPGTRVSLTVVRGRQQRTVELTRALLTDSVVSSRLVTLPGRRGSQALRAGYVRVSEFDENTGSQVRAAVTGLRRHGAESFVLDLRGNPGGLVEEAVTTVSAFVPRGTVVYRQTGQHVPDKAITTDAVPVASTQPLVVLVDGQTASSGEIVAAALRDTRGARLVGQRTYGKGVIQRTWPIEDGALKITVAEYLTPDGAHVDKVGLTPHITLTDPHAAPERLGPVIRANLD